MNNHVPNFTCIALTSPIGRTAKTNSRTQPGAKVQNRDIALTFSSATKPVDNGGGGGIIFQNNGQTNALLQGVNIGVGADFLKPGGIARINGRGAKRSGCGNAKSPAG